MMPLDRCGDYCSRVDGVPEFVFASALMVAAVILMVIELGNEFRTRHVLWRGEMQPPVEIVSGLWMGGETLFPVPPSGFDFVLSLREVPDIGWPSGADQGGPVFLWMPLIDSKILPPEWKIFFAAETLNIYTEGKKVFCHCSEGRNRSGLIVATNLIEHKMYQPQEAIDLIRDKIPGALSNRAFVNWLLEL